MILFDYACKYGIIYMWGGMSFSLIKGVKVMKVVIELKNGLKIVTDTINWQNDPIIKKIIEVNKTEVVSVKGE